MNEKTADIRNKIRKINEETNEIRKTTKRYNKAAKILMIINILILIITITITITSCSTTKGTINWEIEQTVKKDL